MKPFKLINNTDGVDIRDKALGLDVQYESLTPLQNNRGLHIQIQHNGDKATFHEAVRIAQLLTASTDLRSALLNLVEQIQAKGTADQFKFDIVEAALDKAGK